MKEKIIAKRYADAFIEYAQESIGVNQATEEFRWFKIILRNNPQVQDFFNNPGILDSEKNEFADNVFKDVFSEELRNFIKLLIQCRRTVLLFDIADYIRTTYARNEAQDALLKSAYPLDLEMIKTIKDKLEQRSGRKINLFLELDGSLLGGIQAVIGNTVIDGSLKMRLDDLGEKLKNARG